MGDGTYTEKDFYTVISGAKQRKVALQELYEARLNKKNKKTKRSKSFAKDDSDVNLCEEQDEHDIESEEELDTVEDDDEEKIDDAKKCHKKQKIEKEPVLPTRRSGRIRIKEKKRELDSDNEGSESDSESPVQTIKRRYSSTEPDHTASPEIKRKRGRPPKVPQSFDYLEPGEEQDLITDTLMKVEEKMGDSLVKLEGALFKVELTSETDIKDFDLSSQNIEKFSDSIEIKLEEAALGQAIKEELEFDQNHPNSIHCSQNAIEKVTVTEFFVDGRDYSVSTKLVTDEIYSPTADLDSVESSVDSHNNSAYAVVVNVLDDIVSSISE